MRTESESSLPATSRPVPFSVCLTFLVLIGLVYFGDGGILLSGSAFAEADSAACSVSVDGLTPRSFGFSGTPQDPDSLSAIVIWIGFADHPDSNWGPGNPSPYVIDGDTCDLSRPVGLVDQTIPTWFRDVETELEDFLDWQSYGKLYLEATTALRSAPADSLKPWYGEDTAHTPCYWLYRSRDPAAVCADFKPVLGFPANAYGCVNAAVIQEIIADHDSTYLDEYDLTLFLHLADDMVRIRPDGVWEFFAGFDNNGFGCGQGNPVCDRYDKDATTQRPIVGQDHGDPGGTKYMLGHEFGHRLGFGHLPQSEARCDTAGRAVDYGYYGIMGSGLPRPIDFTTTFIPYTMWEISRPENDAWGVPWFDRADFELISTTSLDVKIDDVRSADRNIVVVDTKNDDYDTEFWLIHHQEDKYDSLYGGDLLAIWHMRNPEHTQPCPGSCVSPICASMEFDLEVATGKFEKTEEDCPGTTEDAEEGYDELECSIGKSWWESPYAGSVDDLFAAGDTLSFNTNPNTNDYCTDDFPGDQGHGTRISIEDIRLEGLGVYDYYVDVIWNYFFAPVECPPTSPFLFTWNGRYFPEYVNVLVEYGYPDSLPQQSAGSEYTMLSNPRPFNASRYVFKIRESGESQNYFDQVQVLSIDHDPDVRVTTTRSGAVIGYQREIAPGRVNGQIGNGNVGVRGQPVHGQLGTALTLEWNDLVTPVGSGGVLISTAGKELVEMPRGAGLVVERMDRQGNWVEIAHLVPRSAFTDTYLTDEEMGRSGSQLTLRLRWLGFHALEYVAFVESASPSTWNTTVAVPDSAEVAYDGSRVSELAERDGVYATLGPRQKLTVAVPYTAPEQGKERAVVLGIHGYYVSATEGCGEAVGGESGLIQFVGQNQPNPFNPQTQLKFGLNRGADVSLRIYSVSGAFVRELYGGPLEAGEHAITWDGRRTNGVPAASGVFFYELKVEEEVRTGKMLLVK